MDQEYYSLLEEFEPFSQYTAVLKKDLLEKENHRLLKDLHSVLPECELKDAIWKHISIKKKFKVTYELTYVVTETIELETEIETEEWRLNKSEYSPWSLPRPDKEGFNFARILKYDIA